MAYAMAHSHEEQKKYLIAVKFLKRLFLCAKLLDDFEGTEISLNKIGICYYMGGKFEESLSFHAKHFELTQSSSGEHQISQMISLYNQALCHRQMHLQ